MLKSIRAAYRREIVDDGRELRLVATLAFLVTFVGARIVTHTLQAEAGGGGLEIGTLHIHHVVFGIVLLLLSGILDVSNIAPLLRAGLFGAGGTLVLDEFALVLNLADVYWAPQGRESIDAVVVFATLLWLALLGRGFWSAVWRDAGRLR